MLERLITTVLTYLNAAGYYKSAEEIQNAINVAQLDLYKRLRGNMAQYAPGRPLAAVNPEQTSASSDAVAELYRTLTNQAFIPNEGQVKLDAGVDTTIDLVLSLEVAYNPSPSKYYPVNIVPDNQFLMLKNNPVVPPIKERPIGRLYSILTYEVAPIVDANNFKARVLTLPSPVSFTFTESGGPIPNIIIPDGGNIDWSIDKLDNMVYGTVANLGFNLSNGVLVQSGNAMNDKIL
jgi:hypothetical protein